MEDPASQASSMDHLQTKELIAVGIHFSAEFCSLACGRKSELVCEWPWQWNWLPDWKFPTSLYYVKKKAESSSSSGGREGRYEVTCWSWGAQSRHEKDVGENSRLIASEGVYVAKFMGQFISGKARAQGWLLATKRDPIPERLSLVTVISDYFSMLSGSAIELVKERYGGHITMGDIQWCFTVPSIWDDPAVQTLRECVERAGMVLGPFCPPKAAANASSHPVLFVPEWEAAALHCFRGVRCVEEGSRVLVVDIRSDTTNMAILKNEGGFAAVGVRSADAWSFFNDVDERFYNMLRARIGDRFDEERDRLGVRSRLQGTWETLRTGYDGNEHTVYLELPADMPYRWKIHEMSQRPSIDTDGKDYSRIDVNLKQIFEPVADRIIQLIKEQLRPDVKGLFLMSESQVPPYLGLRMRAAFGNRFGDGMRIPPDPSRIMCQGALTFGLSPALQVSPKTYELGIQRPCSFNPKGIQRPCSFNPNSLDGLSDEFHPNPRGTGFLNEINREPGVPEDDRTPKERVLQERLLSEFDGTFRSCLRAINMACLEGIHSRDGSQALEDFMIKIHDHSIQHAKLVVKALVEFQSRRLRHRESEMEAAHAVTKSERDRFLQQLQGEMRTAESSIQTHKREYEEKMQKMLGEMLEAMGSVRTLKEEVKKLEGEKQSIEAAATAERARFEDAARDQMLCQICQDNPRNVLILPCSHAQFCHACLAEHRRTNRTCPTCRATIREVVPFFS